MPFKDLREFISRLEQAGAAQKIAEEVDWNLEAGAMIRRANEAGLPAPFFQKVKGYPAGYRIFGEMLSSQKQLAIAMDMPPETPGKRLVEEYLQRRAHPVRPLLVSGGPCKENVHVGGDVDLLEFPAPVVHDGDGGRFIATSHITVCKDPDGDWVNWGMYRSQLHSRNTVGIRTNPRSHVMKLRQKWIARGKPMPVAIVLGAEPISTMCAATSIPYGVSEAEVAGGLRRAPAELVRCETVDLAVPASAEIVIEGEMKLNEVMDEGPFAEYTGYRAGHKQPAPVIEVTAVTHRNEPILTMGSEGTLFSSTHTICSIAWSAELLKLLQEQGLPVTAVNQFAMICSIVAVKPRLTTADDVAHAVWASPGGIRSPYVIVVEDDIDPFNLTEVFHTMMTKCHPYRGITRLEHTNAVSIFPWLDRFEQEHLLGAKAYFDCTWPRQWAPSDVPGKASFTGAYPADVQKSALAKWRKYGY